MGIIKRACLGRLLEERKKLDSEKQQQQQQKGKMSEDQAKKEETKETKETKEIKVTVQLNPLRHEAGGYVVFVLEDGKDWFDFEQGTDDGPLPSEFKRAKAVAHYNEKENKRDLDKVFVEEVEERARAKHGKDAKITIVVEE